VTLRLAHSSDGAERLLTVSTGHPPNA
jgi:hypothetical protein